jgi:hypothetical protein
MNRSQKQLQSAWALPSNARGMGAEYGGGKVPLSFGFEPGGLRRASIIFCTSLLPWLEPLF